MTLECFQSIRKQSGELTLSFLIIDNGSDEDKHLQLVQMLHDYGEVEVFRILDNFGPGPAISLGLTKISKNCDYALMCHNDTVMLDGTLSKLLTSITNNSEFAAIGTIQVDFDPPNEVKYTGGKFRNPGFIPSHSKTLLPNVNLKEVDWLDFTSLIFNSRHLEKIGFPNELFDFYWEDSEWSIRAKKSGFKLGICAEACVRHKFGATLGTSSNSRFFEKMVKHHFLVIKMHGKNLDYLVANLYWYYKAIQFLLRFQVRKSIWILKSLRKLAQNRG